MTAKTCGTCKSYNPDRMWCEFVLPISIVNHTRHMMYLTSKYPPCPAHTDREPVCENHNWWRPVSVMDDANWKCITCNAEYPSEIKIKDAP